MEEMKLVSEKEDAIAAMRKMRFERDWIVDKV